MARDITGDQDMQKYIVTFGAFSFGWNVGGVSKEGAQKLKLQVEQKAREGEYGPIHTTNPIAKIEKI